MGPISLSVPHYQYFQLSAIKYSSLLGPFMKTDPDAVTASVIIDKALQSFVDTSQYPVVSIKSNIYLEVPFKTKRLVCMTFSITTHSITDLYVTFSISGTQHNNALPLC
jgi:hypothetical protein